MRKKLLSVILLSGFSLNALAAGTCEFFPNHQMYTFNFTLPATLDVPRDAPYGTVIYETPPVGPLNLNASFKCTADYSFGARNMIGSTTPGNNVLPIGNTGIAWQWIRVDVGGPMTGYPKMSSGPAGNFGLNDSIHALRLIKIGQISGSPTIPSGIAGYTNYGGIDVLALNITNQAPIVPGSCETPDVKVDMGQHDISTFAHNGAFSNSIKFSIDLNNCPESINKISYQLKATSSSPVQNSLRGIIKLSGDSTAKGLALQILTADGTPVIFNEDHPFTDYSPAGGSFNIPLNARYFRTVETGGNGGFDKGMEAGTANASVTFMIKYL